MAQRSPLLKMVEHEFFLFYSIYFSFVLYLRLSLNDEQFSIDATYVKSLFFFFTAMSENYVVFIEQPIKMDLVKIVTSMMRGKSISDCIYWDPNQETVFHVVNKHTGKVTPKSVLNTQAALVFYFIFLMT